MTRADTPLAFAYNTNGFANHRLGDVIDLLARLGYDGVGLTLDVHHLDPLRADDEEVDAIAGRLRSAGLRVVVETGGRYVLDPARKHWPNLVSSEGRDRRIDLLRRAVRIAGRLGADVLSMWAGAPDDGVERDRAWDWLVEGLGEVCRAAGEEGVRIGFEPEPGMLVERMAEWGELRGRVDSEALALTLDLGHIACVEDAPIPDVVRRHAGEIVNVHIEDIRGRTHEHLPFGQGEIDFPPVLAALREIRYDGLVGVELSRNSHDAPVQADLSLAFLRSI